ncbi:DNA starvation/stationary phase protection protein [Devosia sp. XJ19-1]|uniref:DNA starvation/stationary phase protection protein n=1 Tax=Devosia ureilytica TaxID=2952754 RepID=A0A9Q4ALA2_9HYPH|nr:DNA starvation/stationary phase protection protein [Devosia ureilytica]MCP8882343.1 DNA starvation/stationary phase protection protein [Devosia ureilytica]MCP8885770.1 DNA starvation/stationary phase protection protein [Devosia ureilytica]
MFSGTTADQREYDAVPTCLTGLLAQVLALQIRTKGCHWHVSGPHFRSLHSLFDEQAEQLADTADELAERVRALGATTIASLSDLVQASHSAGDGAPALAAQDMLVELRRANRRLAEELKALRLLADSRDDIVTVSAADGWLAQAERRVWMLGASMSEHQP